MRKIPYNSSSLVTEIYTNIPKALRPKPKKEKKKKKGNAERQSSASGSSSTQHAGEGGVHHGDVSVFRNHRQEG